MNKVRLGILGMGNMGSGHLENYLNGRNPEIEITAVCDLNPARLEYALGRLATHRASKPDVTYADITTFADGDEMFTSGLIDAVIIAIPHYGHPEYSMKAMRAGLHVMCEKPAGVYTLQVREMIAEADKHPELKFGMMFNQRTNHIYRKVKEIVDSGELGAIKRTSWIITNWYRPQAYYNSGAWRATWSGEGGGVLPVFVGEEGTVLAAGIGGGEEEVLMAAGEVDGDRLAWVQGRLDHDHRCRFKVGVLREGESSRAAAGVAVLVVDPEAQTQPLALVGHEGEDGMLLGVLQVVTGADVADDAAEAAGLNVEEVVGHDGFFLVEGGLGGVGEVVDDLEGEVGDVGGHGGAPFVE